MMLPVLFSACRAEPFVRGMLDSRQVTGRSETISYREMEDTGIKVENSNPGSLWAKLLQGEVPWYFSLV